jgi:hypothetical protein
VLFDSNDQVSLQSSVSPTTFGATLDEFVNTEIVTYTSDFSAGLDGWATWANITAASAADPVDAGNVLKVTVDTSLDAHFVNGGPVNQGNTYSISAQVYVPSSNAILDGIGILDSFGGMLTNYNNITRDQWVNVPTSGTAVGTKLSIRGKSGTDFTFQGNGTDVYYIRNVVITNTSKNGHVTTWYDQSGNGNDATQTAAASQPKIVEGGVLVLSNGNAAIKATSNNELNFSMASLSADGQQSVFGVLENDVTSQNNFTSAFSALSNSDGSNGFNRRPYWYTAPNGSLVFSADSLGGYTNSDRDRRLYSHIMEDTAGGTSTVYQDGTQVDTRSITLDANPNFLSARVVSVGTNAVGALYTSELIYYPSDQSANRVAIEANINNHYFPIAEDLYFRA